MAEIEIKAVERVIGETEVGVCSCGPTLNDRVTSFLLFQVSFFNHTHVKNKHTNKQTQPESVPISTRIYFKHGDVKTIIEMIRSFGSIVSGEKECFFCAFQ